MIILVLAQVLTQTSSDLTYSEVAIWLKWRSRRKSQQNDNGREGRGSQETVTHERPKVVYFGSRGCDTKSSLVDGTSNRQFSKTKHILQVCLGQDSMWGTVPRTVGGDIPVRARLVKAFQSGLAQVRGHIQGLGGGRCCQWRKLRYRFYSTD